LRPPERWSQYRTFCSFVAFMLYQCLSCERSGGVLVCSIGKWGSGGRLRTGGCPPRLVSPAVTRRLVVVGGGRMGEALVAGLLAAGWDATDLAVVEKLAVRRAALAETPGLVGVPVVATLADVADDGGADGV